MSWCYRVIQTGSEDDPRFSICEVYDGNSFCPASVTHWETVEDLKGTLELMLSSFEKEIIVLP